ncbi:MAG: tetratricopeptide repeat protein [Rugosibacter sp.]|nr:tetratricopeptide repeat protein [Rugosibacter sp.]
MSMINQMLKNLDKRHAAAGEGQSLIEGVFLTSRVRKSHYSPMIFPLVLAVVMMAGAGALVWSQYHKSGAPVPVARVVAANALPGANSVPVQRVPVIENGSSPTPSTSVTQIASTDVSRPLEPLTGIDIKPEVKDSISALVVTSVPEDNVKVPRGPSVTKSTMTVITNENADKDSAKILEQNTFMPNSRTDQVVSFKVVSAQQRSDNFYRQAISLMQQSRVTEAQDALRQSIAANSANHIARQVLAGLLIDAGRNAEATALLRDGLDFVPGHGGFSMMLARLHVANGAREDALTILEQGLISAADDAEYHAFFAALLQSQGRHDEATQHYITALRSNPSMPTWLVGVGISLQAQNKMNDAAEAFQRALDTGELTLVVAQFADQRLKQIRQERLPENLPGRLMGAP